MIEPHWRQLLMVHATLGEMDTTQLVMLGAAALGLTVLLISTRKKIRANAAVPKATVRERYQQLSQAPVRANPQQDLHDLIRELDDLSRQINARIDTRFAKLETVIRDADQRIEELTELLRRMGDMQGVTQTSPVPVPPKAPLKGRQREQIDFEPASPPDNLRSRVAQLADHGHSPLEIAESMNKPVGEIELMLALHRTRPQGTGVGE